MPAYQATRQPTRPTYQASSNVPTNNAPTNYRPAPTPANQIGAYAYPSNNQVIKTFNPNSGTMGMWFAGRQGDPVKASQAGTVMYAGNELAEYGNLVMIRHDQTYITAYAHLNQILVQEGQTNKGNALQRWVIQVQIMHAKWRRNFKYEKMAPPLTQGLC